MDQLRRNSEILSKYIPQEAVPIIAEWVVQFDFKLKITKERNTKLGDYRPPFKGTNHQITINHNLNKYAFLITLVHEIAHLTTFNKFLNTVSPHGKEWKEEFRKLMSPFLDTTILPVDVLYAVRKYLINPAAASCSDRTLLRILKLYDEQNHNLIFLEKIPYRTVFLYNGDRLFEKGERIRTRYRCKELPSGVIYLFNPLTEVELLDKDPGFCILQSHAT